MNYIDGTGLIIILLIMLSIELYNHRKKICWFRHYYRKSKNYNDRLISSQRWKARAIHLRRLDRIREEREKKILDIEKRTCQKIKRLL